MSQNNNKKLDDVVAKARATANEREQGYREQALKIYPWVCGRCAREFTQANLRELTVHHKDHDHDNNPRDGSNWELLCLYCHDNEHQRHEEAYQRPYLTGSENNSTSVEVTHNPFADLANMLKKS